MKKDIKINMSKLSIGGMEKALVDLLNNSDLTKNYNVTLLLVYNGENNYLNMLPSDVKVDVVYKGKWNIFGKIIAGIKLIFKTIFAKKYYASICYTHHHKILSSLTRRESENTICFVHTDLKKSRTNNELEKLCNNLKFDKFKKIICVSECAKKSFSEIYADYKGKIYVANNYIDGKGILDKSNEKINDVKKDNCTTFINVARHDDNHKKISRIINASIKLNNENYDFRVLLVGNGKDTKTYEDIINENNLYNVVLLGSKINPFPYYKVSDAFLFSSNFEGYGIVLNEARVLNLPIITTDVADAKIITDEGYGILCENSDDGIYHGMKEFLDKGYKINKKFDYIKFNNKITSVLNKAIKE